MFICTLWKLIQTTQLNIFLSINSSLILLLHIIQNVTIMLPGLSLQKKNHVNIILSSSTLNKKLQHVVLIYLTPHDHKKVIKGVYHFPVGINENA